MTRKNIRDKLKNKKDKIKKKNIGKLFCVQKIISW